MDQHEIPTVPSRIFSREGRSPFPRPPVCSQQRIGLSLTVGCRLTVSRFWLACSVYYSVPLQVLRFILYISSVWQELKNSTSDVLFTVFQGNGSFSGFG